ncbi:hypothetical protein P7K49_005625 [Saguinus oedipus]|uniref:Nucleolar protein 16 n=1 Tax=Saguinus oedipus TaxID=9490 RepID=A0ABQ9W0P3_SAGOE|nr:hypothetical protein P7K49_005625 [Saguinus oedipus]
MPKAKGKTRRQKFGYNVNRKRLKRNARRKAAPRIECSHIKERKYSVSGPHRLRTYMVENHVEDYKAMAHDEKNCYQDTPKRIRNKINVYRRVYPAEWQDFLDSLQKSKMEFEWLVYIIPAPG